jgi:hypothetical protein
MTWRDVLAAGILFLLPGAAMAAAPGAPAPPDKTPPMVFYVAKGAPDSCGAGCDSWIAVEGRVDADTADRFRKFLHPLRDRNLPIYFLSPGGNLLQALAMGRMLHERPTIARVARTMVKECGTDQTSEACLKLKQSGHVLDAELSTGPAVCASACPYLLLGASTREIAPNAILGVHSPKVVLYFRGPPEARRANAMQRAKAIERDLDHANQIVAVYLARMHIDRGLLDFVETVKNESMHFLTREEIVRFGIDRREFVETPWRFENISHGVSKITVARKADGVSFRRMDWRLFCAGKDRARLTIVRQADEGVAGSLSVSSIAGSERPLQLAALAVLVGKYAVLNTVVASDTVKNWSTLPHLQVAETTSVLGSKPTQATFEIGTSGLEQAWSALAATCATAPSNGRPFNTVSGLPNAPARVAASPGMPGGLAFAEAPTARVFAARRHIDEFMTWAESKGLKVLPKAPRVRESVNRTQRPSVSRDSLILGSPEFDYLVPGLYVNIVGASQGFETNRKTGIRELEWTAANYMASRFEKTVFPNPSGPHASTSDRPAEVARLFNATYGLFDELIDKFGNDAVEAGVVNMMNEWNPESDLPSSLASFAAGMTRGGAKLGEAQAVFAKFNAQIAAGPVASDGAAK